MLGVAWSYTFSVGSAISPTKTRAGLLAGKTLCLKDNICVAGIPQVNGTDMIEPWILEAAATVVTRILEAMGETIGTATCENISYSPLSNTSSTDTVHNSCAENYSAGGSSSGVGALVGSNEGYVDMGIGADQGGSIRQTTMSSSHQLYRAQHLNSSLEKRDCWSSVKLIGELRSILRNSI